MHEPCVDQEEFFHPVGLIIPSKSLTLTAPYHPGIDHSKFHPIPCTTSEPVSHPVLLSLHSGTRQVSRKIPLISHDSLDCDSLSLTSLFTIELSSRHILPSGGSLTTDSKAGQDTAPPPPAVASRLTIGSVRRSVEASGSRAGTAGSWPGSALLDWTDGGGAVRGLQMIKT